MRLFFSVGEPSGDLHGSNLIRHLRESTSDVQCWGYGGPRMAQAGCVLQTDLTQLAVMGLARVLPNLRQFRRLIKDAERTFQTTRPDAVVLIDFPGFNWWIARAAKRHGIPVFYYGVPQLWAWGRWRIRKMRRLVDHALCKLPFEAKWYRQLGCNAAYMGHPYFDELVARQLDEEFVAAHADPSRPLVTILPGSRRQEVEKNLPTFLRAAELIQRRLPDCRFAIASFNDQQAQLAHEALADASVSIPVHIGRTGELIEAATCCLACSGSVSLELLYHTTPTVIHYRVPWLLHFAARHLFISVRFVTLVNLLSLPDPLRDTRLCPPTHPDAERVPFPEYVTHRDESASVAERIVEWLTDADALEKRRQQLRNMRSQITLGGASQVACDYLINSLSSPSVPSRAAA